jgi:phage terminase large subunit-like protein
LPDSFVVRPYFWIPEAGLAKRERVDGKPYRQWVKDGLLYTSPGEKVNHRLIFEKIKDLQAIFSLREIAFDRWGSQQIVEDLEGMGLTVSPHGQGFKDMELPMGKLLELVTSSELLHCGNDILDWMAGNLNAKEDDAGNRKPHKGTRGSKIDGMVALLMALGVILRNRTGRYPSALAEMFPTGEAA